MTTSKRLATSSTVTGIATVRTEQNSIEYLAFNTQRPLHRTTFASGARCLKRSIGRRSPRKIYNGNWPLATTELPVLGTTIPQSNRLPSIPDRAARELIRAGCVYGNRRVKDGQELIVEPAYPTAGWNGAGSALVQGIWQNRWSKVQISCDRLNAVPDGASTAAASTPWGGLAPIPSRARYTPAIAAPQRSQLPALVRSALRPALLLEQRAA